MLTIQFFDEKEPGTYEKGRVFELAVEAGGSTGAEQWLEVVRENAGKPHLDIQAELEAAGKLAFATLDSAE